MSTNTSTFTTQDIERLFLDWLRGRPVPMNINHFQQVLAESETKLPEDVCREEGFAEGTTVGHAVRSSVAFFNQLGEEWRVDTRIEFKDEAESLRWWRKNRDNPKRVRLTHQGDGRWSLEVAPIEGPVKVDWQGGF